MKSPSISGTQTTRVNQILMTVMMVVACRNINRARDRELRVASLASQESFLKEVTVEQKAKWYEPSSIWTAQGQRRSL